MERLASQFSNLDVCQVSKIRFIMNVQNAFIGFPSFGPPQFVVSCMQTIRQTICPKGWLHVQRHSTSPV